MADIRCVLKNYFKPNKNTSIKLKKTYLRYCPETIWIEPTNNCNYRCKSCPITTGLKRKQGFMDLDLYKKIINDIAKCMKEKWISLHYLGEPLIHKEIASMVKIAKDHNIKVLFFTNGSLLTVDLFKKLCDSGLDRLTFSLDATNKTDYEKIQLGGNWDKVIENINNAIDFKTKNDVKISLTINHLAKTESEFNKDKQQLRRLFAGKDIRIQGHIYHDWAGNVEMNGKKYVNQKNNRKPCNFLFSAMVIMWDGLVVPCTRSPNGELVVGDAKKENIIDIWNSNKFQELRKMSLTRNYEMLPELCKCCIQSTNEVAHLS